MFLSGGAAAMNLVLAANAFGYGANWITNWYSDTEEGRRILGLAPHERVVGFVHIGTFAGSVPERPRAEIPRRLRLLGPWEGWALVLRAENGHGLPHDPLKAIVAPRPIGWISTMNGAGEVNLAPYSFFNAFSTHPFLVWFASGGEKDSVAFARDSGEFVVNLVGRELAVKMNASSVNAPRGVSEFGHAGLEAAPSRLVKAPRVAGAPAALECKADRNLRAEGSGGPRPRHQGRHRRGGRHPYRRRHVDRRALRRGQGGQCRAARLHGLLQRDRGFFDAPSALEGGLG